MFFAKEKIKKIMKIYITAVILLLGTLVLKAQTLNSSIGINEVVMTTSKGDKPAFRMFIPKTDEKIVADAWNRFHKNLKSKPKFDKLQFEYFTDDAYIPQISQNTIDIYVKMLPKDGGILFSAAFDLGGIFISSKNTPDKFMIAENLLSKFYVQLAYEAIEAEYAANQQKITELEEANKSLESDMERLKGSISRSEEIISKEMKTIETNEKTQTEIDKKIKEKELIIQEKRNVITQFSVPNIEKEIKTLEITAKKNQTEQERAEREIAKKEEQIKLLQMEIAALQASFTEKTSLLEQNQISIEDLKSKIAGFNLPAKEQEIMTLEQALAADKAEKDRIAAEIMKSKTMIENSRKEIMASETAISQAKKEKDQINSLIVNQKEEAKKLETLKSSYKE